MGTRTRQWLVAVLGGAVCATMLVLGLWQMRVFEDKEDASAAARAAQPPVSLVEVTHPDGTVEDVYGRRVVLPGRYLPDQELRVVGEDGTVRVLTAFLADDGRVLPVVRGTVADTVGALPQPPAGVHVVTGVFLPSEAAAEHEVPRGALASVRLPALAQAWTQQLFPGFVTLPAVDSAAQGLGEAGISLPSGNGSVQNIGYALQWWVFAGFGAFMTVRFVRVIGRHGTLGTLSDEEEE